ncbi:DUF362 domain-containing protein [bacterium]|nr:DUF362 domain-containing protein [bacterium]
MDICKVTNVALLKTEKISYNYRLTENSLAQLFELLNFDSRHIGQKDWNPLKELINRGDKVLIKPNLVRESHLYKNEWEQVITHKNIIAAVVHYAYKALEGTGKIIIADGPQTDSNFEKIYTLLEFKKLKRHYQEKYNYNLQIFDIREEQWEATNGVISKRTKLPGDPLGYTEIDLGADSEFINHKNDNYYGAAPDVKEVRKHHSGRHHQYRIATSALDADIIINLPKLKTHKKTGITISLKNLLGVHGNRNWLPHHTVGTPSQGGDEFNKSTISNKIQGRFIRVLQQILTRRGTGGPVEKLLKKIGYTIFGKTERVVRSGNWYGNDTVWRTVLDLNKILLYSTSSGAMKRTPQRKYLNIVDGIIAGEGDGPMAPDSKPTGILIGGINPVAVDAVCAHIMGFDVQKISLLKKAFQIRKYPLVIFPVEKIDVASNQDKFNKKLLQIDKRNTLHFKPHFGWKNHIELN